MENDERGVMKEFVHRVSKSQVGDFELMRNRVGKGRLSKMSYGQQAVEPH